MFPIHDIMVNVILVKHFVPSLKAQGALQSHYPCAHTHSDTDGGFAAEYWRQPITTRRNVGVSALPKDTLGTNPAIF